MLKAIKIRLYPNKEQRNLLDRHFGACRFIYNAVLEYKKTMYRDYGIKLSKFDLFKELTHVKQDPLFEWLYSVKNETLQESIANMDTAFKNFYGGRGYPKFKNKKSKQSFTQTQSFRILDNLNKLIFLKHKIKFNCSEYSVHELRTYKIKRITYSKDNLNHYHASILIEMNHDLTKSKLQTEVGIDLGLKHFMVTSSGEFIENPRYFRESQEKLARQQRKLSKKKKGSNNFEKQRIKVAKIHKKIHDQRIHFFHQLTNKLIDENQVIHLETLKVKNMIQNHNLAKSIQDASWSTFVNILTYKSKWYGREVYRIDTFSPTSKTCSCCRWVNEELTLADRNFECKECGLSIDRDLNAAINILNFSKNEITNRDELARINASGEQSIDTRRTKKKTKDLIEC